MAGKSRKPKSKKGRRSTKRHTQRKRHDSTEPDLIGDIRRALADPNPVTLLSYVSTLLWVTEPPRDLPFADPADSDSPRVSREDFVSMLLDAPTPETSALLAVIAELAIDDVLRARIGRELATRPEIRPAWLGQLPNAHTHRAVRMRDVLGDGDDIMLGTQLPGGQEFTFVVYVDANMGSIVKDAFTVPETIEGVVTASQRLTEDPDIRWEAMDLADARVVVHEAIRRGLMTYPPTESESWPRCRALLEWIVRRMPEGGSTEDRPEWDAAAAGAIADRFCASPDGSSMNDPDRRGLLDDILFYATGWGSGDPLRWSPPKVEILLYDWIPRKIVAPVEYLTQAPDLLRAFVRFAHAEVGLRAQLTDDALAVIDELEPEYQRLIRTRRLQGPEALLATMGVRRDDHLDDSEFARWMIDDLARQVGGLAALARLDDAALPDEPFDWMGVPVDVAARVDEVLALVDRCCDEMFDVEIRTACRRLIAHIASTGPEAFRRIKAVGNTAASVVWIVTKVNKALGLYYGFNGPQAQELAAHFGLKGGPSQRSEALLRAGGFDWRATHDLTLGSPEYLTSRRRQYMIDMRDRYRDEVDDDPDLDDDLVDLDR